jgi:hypothetical protein
MLSCFCGGAQPRGGVTLSWLPRAEQAEEAARVSLTSAASETVSAGWCREDDDDQQDGQDAGGGTAGASEVVASGGVRVTVSCLASSTLSCSGKAGFARSRSPLSQFSTVWRYDGKTFHLPEGASAPTGGNALETWLANVPSKGAEGRNVFPNPDLCREVSAQELEELTGGNIVYRPAPPFFDGAPVVCLKRRLPRLTPAAADPRWFNTRNTTLPPEFCATNYKDIGARRRGLSHVHRQKGESTGPMTEYRAGAMKQMAERLAECPYMRVIMTTLFKEANIVHIKNWLRLHPNDHTSFHKDMTRRLDVLMQGASGAALLSLPPHSPATAVSFLSPPFSAQSWPSARSTRRRRWATRAAAARSSQRACAGSASTTSRRWS